MAVRRALFVLVAVLVRCLAIDATSSAFATDWLHPSLTAGSALAYGVAAGAFHSLALTRTP